MNDLVSVESLQGVRRIVGTRSTEPRYQVQHGSDAATQSWIRTDQLTMVQKHKPEDAGPGFYPDRSIMDNQHLGLLPPGIRRFGQSSFSCYHKA